MSNVNEIKELFDDIKNIDFSNINSFFVDYTFITGDESLVDEINKYLDETYPIEKYPLLNRPKVKYEPLCPSDKVYWFREGLDLPMKNSDNFFDNMRDATKEEQKKVNSYIDNISEDTGVNFWDILEENDELNRIADEFNKIPEEYLIPYDELIKIIESTEDE